MTFGRRTSLTRARMGSTQTFATQSGTPRHARNPHPNVGLMPETWV